MKEETPLYLPFCSRCRPCRSLLMSPARKSMTFASRLSAEASADESPKQLADEDKLLKLEPTWLLGAEQSSRAASILLANSFIRQGSNNKYTNWPEADWPSPHVANIHSSKLKILFNIGYYFISSDILSFSRRKFTSIQSRWRRHINWFIQIFLFS